MRIRESWLFSLLLPCLLVVGGIALLHLLTPMEGSATQSAQTTQTTPTAPSTPTAPLPQGAPTPQITRDTALFAKYEAEESKFSPSLPDYQINLKELANLKHFEKANKRKFKPEQLKALTNQNFFIARNLDKFYADNPDEVSHRYDDWAHLYSNIGGPFAPATRRPEHAVFITTDFLLHLYHRLLEKQVEFLEQKSFYPKLKKITDALLKLALEEYSQAGSSEQRESLQRLITYFAVPGAILQSAQEFSQKETIADDRSDSQAAVMGHLAKGKDRMPPEAYALAQQELALVLAADQITPSPILGRHQEEQGLSLPEDYTQFAPRSHYNKNPVLRTYFRSMMWYGRMNFLLSSPKLTRDAANITRLLDQAGLRQDWEDIYLTTSFLVGESDDLGIPEYRQAMSQAAGGGTPKELSPEAIAKIQNILKNYRKPQIMSSFAFGDQVFNLTQDELRQKTQGFRFMGQRFTPDAFILARLTQGDEKPDPQTGERLPSQPTALMVMSILGSKTAEPLLAEWMAKNAPDSRQILKNRLSELTQHFTKLSLADWTQNIYWAWLYSIQGLFSEAQSQPGYPRFMRSEEWRRKNLQGGLGSWTELKHDTLLYAKQVYAEMGDGAEEQRIPPVPKGYVEPNLTFFDRFIPLVKMTTEGITKRGGLEDEFLERNKTFLEAAEFFRKIALAQLNNQTISDDDFEKLRLEAGNLAYTVSPLPSEEGVERYGRTALIADVHTDMLKKQILYEATGIPNYIYVAVKDKNGTRLTKGLVYTHYEFPRPLGKRLTDEEWQAWNYRKDKSKIPPLAPWAASLIK